jgi:pimeloyl-ACP methyl ester carboxylesterase
LIPGLTALILGCLLLGAAFLTYGFWLGWRPGPDEPLPEPQYVNAAGRRLAYYRSAGSDGAVKGPTLVLIHGLGTWSYTWRYLFPLLDNEYDLVAIDLLGCGGSDKPHGPHYGLDELTRLLDDAIRRGLGLKPEALVGSSLGGLLALSLARLDPGLYPRVITLAPAALGRLFRVPAWPVTGLGRGARIFRWFVNRWTMPYMIGYVFRSFRPVHRGSLLNYLEPYRDADTLRAFFAQIAAIADPRLPGLLAGIRARVLVLWGERDPQVSRRAIENLMEVLPGAELSRLARTAHHPHETHPEKVAEAIRTWLGKK